VLLTTIGFDADDTLWHSENHFALTTQRFCELLKPWSRPASAKDPSHEESSAQELIEAELIEVQRRNLNLLGYGAKAFTMSMIETAIEVSDGQIPASALQQILLWGHELLEHPVELLSGVEQTVHELAESFDLLLITKGDLLHQESKIARSGIAQMFSGIEILSNKSASTYSEILNQRSVHPSNFLMVGNSLKSDVLPVLQLGGYAVHVPYQVTWALEEHDPLEQPAAEFLTLRALSDLPALIQRLHSSPAHGQSSGHGDEAGFS